MAKLVNKTGGRQKGATCTDTWKSKIQATQIMNRLLKHFDGEIELSTTQLKAADMILKKVVPDLSSVSSKVEHKGNVTLVTNIQSAPPAKGKE